MIDLLTDELLKPIIHLTSELIDVELFIEQADKRFEQLAIEPALIKVVGRPVRGRDDNHAALDQLGKQTTENHRVGDIANLELVEAEQPTLLGNLVGGREDGIFATADVGVAETIDAFVGVHHELVEMDAPLGHDRRGIEEHVHHQRLAAPDITIEIDAPRRFLATLEAEQLLPFANPAGSVMNQPMMQHL